MLEINGVNFDKYIQRGTYQCTKASEYTEWKDANGRKHKSEYRKRVSGSCTLAFVVPAEHDHLLANLQIATHDGYTRMKVHAQNTNEEIEIDGFYEMEAGEYLDLGNGYARDILTFSFEEA